MLTIALPGHDPYFNLATEEHFFKNYDEDVLIVYRNRPSIVIGKNQNANAEINLPYVWENNIPVIRRLSGGGTVFHDLGNVNYSIMLGGEGLKKVDFRRYTAPVIALLQKMGTDAKFSGLSDISIDGLKVSGNAEHLWRKRILHHGTLLYSSQLDALREAIKVRPQTYRDKAVQSNRKTVTNISEQLASPPSIDRFIDMLLSEIPNDFGGSEAHTLSDQDNAAIQELASQRYKTWDWNFARSPDYRLNQKKEINGAVIQVGLKVKKGIITKAEFSSDKMNKADFEAFQFALVGTRHFPDNMISQIQAGNLPILLNNVPLRLMLDFLF